MNGDSMRSTTDGLPARAGHETAGAPAPINPSTGQHEAYWILSDEERAKGFVRPVRDQYRHVGPPGPTHPLRELTEDERVNFDGLGWCYFEAYPPGGSSLGRYWSQTEIDRARDGGCQDITTMSRAIAETYARQPGFYGRTFCITCREHLPIGERGEFTWLDAMGRDTNERVGT